MSKFLELLEEYKRGMDAEVDADKRTANAMAAPVVAALKEAKAFLVLTDYMCNNGKIIGMTVRSLVPRISVKAYSHGTSYLFWGRDCIGAYTNAEELIEAIAYEYARRVEVKSPCR